MNEQGLIGVSVPRTDALEKVLGKTRYSQDFWMEGMLYGGVLRSPHASARILAIHTQAARGSQLVFPSRERALE